MQGVAYCRVSTKEQVQNLSLPTQMAACREYCRRQNIDLVETFVDEGESAKTADRPELQKLLNVCRQRKGQIQFLIVYNVSRFSRDNHDFVVLSVQLRSYGVSVRSVMESFDDTSTGKLMQTMLSAFAQFDNDQKAERTTTGMQAAIERGR